MKTFRRGKLIKHNGQALSLLEWANRLGYSKQSLHRRLQCMTVAKALEPNTANTRQAIERRRRLAVMQGVPTIPDDVYDVLTQGREPSLAQEANAAEFIREATALIRRRHLEQRADGTVVMEEDCDE